MLLDLRVSAPRALAPSVALLLIAFSATGQTPAPGATAPAMAAPPAVAPPVQPTALVPKAAAPVTVYCLPECRAGFTCVEGKCVSACNPPCSADETCTANAQCTPKNPPPAPPPATTIVVETRVDSGPPPDPGWATGAGVFGVVAAAGTLGLTIGSEMTKSQQNPSLPLGVSATLLVAVGGPIVAVGAGSARQGGDVKGSLGLRITGWVGYGLMLADASVLIGMGVNEVEPPDGVIVTVGALGAISLLSFSADAFFSAAEARTARDARPSPGSFQVVPTVAWARSPGGTLLPVLGARGSF